MQGRSMKGRESWSSLVDCEKASLFLYNLLFNARYEKHDIDV